MERKFSGPLAFKAPSLKGHQDPGRLLHSVLLPVPTRLWMPSLGHDELSLVLNETQGIQVK